MLLTGGVAPNEKKETVTMQLNKSLEHRSSGTSCEGLSDSHRTVSHAIRCEFQSPSP